MSESFDYVIVGGGSAGCVLAARLSEDPDAQVLLLEVGGGDERPDVAAPAAWPSLMGTDLDWAYVTEPQAHAAERRIRWPRGRVLGGSSAINALVFVRGMPTDYDAWADAGCDGWDRAGVLPAFKALEDFRGGDEQHRSAGGPLPLRVPQERSPLSEAVREAALEHGLAWKEDLNHGPPDGVGWNQLTRDDGGARASAASAFLRPALGRPNLTVRTGARVRRVVIEDGRATAVSYTREGRAERAEVAAEAILCAGAVESPKLLMLSGVGPAAHLREHGIEPLVELPGVGENLHDHPGVAIAYEASRPVPPGPNQYSELGIFCRTQPELELPDVQYGVLTVPIAAEGLAPPQQGFTFYPSCMKPQSRGTLRLRTADPGDAPLIDPAYLREEADRRVLLGAIELSRELAGTAALRPWVAREALPGADARDEAALRDYLARAVDTWFHPVGTCRMGVDGDAVVDPQLRVHGVERLRVADASVMPEITSGNTNGPTLMIAWKAADAIGAGA